METKLSQIKNIFALAILAIGVSFSACSSDNDDQKKDPTLKLKAAKSQIVPFEDLKVSIDVDLDLLYENYDSITWKGNGVAYFSSFVIWGSPWTNEDDERDVRFTDYNIGKHKIYAFGYKDGKLVSKDSVAYEVIKPKGDFLSVRWNTIKENQYLRYTTGMTPANYLPTDEGWIKTGGTSLEFNHIVKDKGTEYAKLQFCPWTSESNVIRANLKSIPDINNFDWNNNRDSRYAEQANIEYEFFHNYLIELYGNPILVYSGNEVSQTTLKEEYAKRFDYVNLIDFYPIEIWETPTSVICLFASESWSEGKIKRGLCTVIAQPRKK